MYRSGVTRRVALQLMGSAAALALLSPLPAMAQDGMAGRIIVLSDLHSAYERTGQLLAAIRAEIDAQDIPHIIAINGDIFEMGNVVAQRSEGAIDWAFLEALSGLAPTVVNVGNHEPDVVAGQDLAEFIARAEALGITVVSNIVDARTGEAYAAADAVLQLGEMPVTLVGIATDAINTYPAATREWLEIPAPAAWASAELGGLLVNDGVNVILSHAGVVADREILEGLPEGSLLVGGHDHLRFVHEGEGVPYLHTGSWSSAFTIIGIGGDGSFRIEQADIALDGETDEALATLIAATLEEHLTEEETAIVGESANALSLGDTARKFATALAVAAEADVGFIGHTTFGTGLPAGEVSKYVFDSVVRFDGKVMVAEVSAEVLEEILSRTNQDGEIALEAMTGDFLYAAPTELPEKETYRIATNDWSAMNKGRYFGREDLEFTEVEGLMVKTIAREAI